ncbi:DNA mismatch repair protein MutL [Robiginitalea myxolifaciens]|uniref:DNA mismatch repair protein MutL n=1 Tax=Robiginitalea myxolifaciens TaxID=400055 RepID=A0A1I6FNE8_9FLAO|nr:DNA mismatch repair endonuclease MutL [Robiginitalea myxolifaciens]SFR31428.1 DNA mismatch repair protein MutL [Robiginitalea myxolifaciens]
MADRIKVLPDHVANQIAAGEVVQRPASIVKELLENAIDSGATRIELVVRDGGKALVQVVDNGCGMSPEDAALSFKRHATSKIQSAADLFQLHTKGFRGEALASIAAIAQVEMLTRESDTELGIKLRLAGDQVQLKEAVVTPVGTSVSVKNLFFNIPARRNFLKSAKVEFRHVLEEFNRVALVHPEVAFSLTHNDQEVHQLPESPLRQRLTHLMGRRMDDRLVPVQEETQLARLEGFICKPEFARKSRGEQYFFVNRRFIKSSYLHHAVISAFEGLLKPDVHPGYFLYLDLPPDRLDINIHPTKTEVKFEDEQSLYAILRSAIKHSLGQFSIRPVLDFESDQNLETPYGYRNREAVSPTVSVDRSFNPFADNAGAPAARKRTAYEHEAFEIPADLIIESEGSQANLFTEDRDDNQQGIFQLGKRYIVSRIKSGIVLIDQHRAHQRVIYEQLMQNLTRNMPNSQALLFPIKLPLEPADMHILKGLEDTLGGMGFSFGDWKSDCLEIIGIPEELAESQAAELIDDLLADWKTHEDDAHFSQADRLARSMSRSMAVKPGAALDPVSCQTLVHDLFACKEPDLSPSHKPIHTTLSLEDIAKKLN